MNVDDIDASCTAIGSPIPGAIEEAGKYGSQSIIMLSAYTNARTSLRHKVIVNVRLGLEHRVSLQALMDK